MKVPWSLLLKLAPYLGSVAALLVAHGSGIRAGAAEERERQAGRTLALATATIHALNVRTAGVSARLDTALVANDVLRKIHDAKMITATKAGKKADSSETAARAVVVKVPACAPVFDALTNRGQECAALRVVIGVDSAGIRQRDSQLVSARDSIRAAMHDAAGIPAQLHTVAPLLRAGERCRILFLPCPPRWLVAVLGFGGGVYTGWKVIK